MGCCGSKAGPEFILKKELSKEEKVIREKEKSIPWSTKGARELQQTLRANSLEGQMSVAQLKRATHHLELDADMFVNPESPVYKFLKKLINDRKLYDVKRLALCGIMVGQGTVKDKASVIFEHFDEDASGMLEKAEIVAMLNQMIEISVEKIPSMAKGDNLLTEEEVKGYTDRLLAAKDSYINKVVASLLGGDTGISIEGFEKKLEQNPELQRLIWSYGIRMSLYEESCSSLVPSIIS